MITEHKQLLQSIQVAERQAAALKAEGEGVDGIIRNLRDANRQTASRISYYESAAREKKAVAPAPAAPKADKPKEDPKP